MSRRRWVVVFSLIAVIANVDKGNRLAIRLGLAVENGVAVSNIHRPKRSTPARSALRIGPGLLRRGLDGPWAVRPSL
jgi:hypothetical protein